MLSKYLYFGFGDTKGVWGSFPGLCRYVSPLRRGKEEIVPMQGVREARVCVRHISGWIMFEEDYLSQEAWMPEVTC